MKLDLYTKVVLTVIAVCLVVIAGKQVQLIPTAQAASGDVMQVDIIKINGYDINTIGVLPVRVK